jgi:hypothetical protein
VRPCAHWPQVRKTRWLADGGHPADASRRALLLLAAGSMGMQSATVRCLGKMSTTYLTSTLTSILFALAIRRWPTAWQRSTGILITDSIHHARKVTAGLRTELLGCRFSRACRQSSGQMILVWSATPIAWKSASYAGCRDCRPGHRRAHG